MGTESLHPVDRKTGAPLPKTGHLHHWRHGVVGQNADVGPVVEASEISAVGGDGLYDYIEPEELPYGSVKFWAAHRVTNNGKWMRRLAHTSDRITPSNIPSIV
uniref:Uncharacterized protein n=1 Tax=Oryza rufipogon TaxID=4529 RepID=A0A0E0QIR6_ORYRU